MFNSSLSWHMLVLFLVEKKINFGPKFTKGLQSQHIKYVQKNKQRNDLLTFVKVWCICQSAQRLGLWATKIAFFSRSVCRYIYLF